MHADRPFGGFPPTWRAWFMAMGERAGKVAGAPVADYLAVFLARPLRPRPKAAPPLDRWRAFARLARQQWEPAPRDQRGLRRFAAAFSGLLHLVFGVLLLWLGFVQLGDAPPEARQAGESTLIEYVGEGTPAETGGAPAAGDRDAPASAAASASTSTPAAAASAPSMPPTTPTRQAEATSSQPTPPEQTPSPPTDAAAPQPLVVTETPTTDIDFTLPAPVPMDPTIPRLALRVPEVAAQATEVETFKAATAVPNIQRATPRPAAPTVPALRTEVTEVEAQRAPAPVVARQVSPSAQRMPTLRVPELRTAPGEVQVRAAPAPATTSGASAPAPTPSRLPASGTAPSSDTATAPATAATSGGRQPAGSGRPTAAAPAGEGPTPSPRPGAAPSTVRSDDWGASDRNVPGNSTAGRSPGLFNNDGSVRLPGDGGRVGGGLPPGTVIEDFEKIDRMGTWLKRPPLDYTPTRFDRFWIPNRSLLEEWVSRGIKNVAIPIPGTTKRIMCTVSLLQGGGGCTIHDPNLLDQEAIAQPPPDVPFKPELQEDRDSLPRTNGP